MDIKVHGLKELQKKLIEIGSVSGTKSMRSAMMTATKEIQDRAKSTAPKASGALSESIGRTFSFKNDTSILNRGSRFTVSIGPKLRNRKAIVLYNLIHKRNRRGIYHGHFVEFGTDFGVRPTHWLRNALQSTATHSVNKLAEALKKRIETVTRNK